MYLQLHKFGWQRQENCWGLPVTSLIPGSLRDLVSRELCGEWQQGILHPTLAFSCIHTLYTTHTYACTHARKHKHVRRRETHQVSSCPHLNLRPKETSILYQFTRVHLTWLYWYIFLMHLTNQNDNLDKLGMAESIIQHNLITMQKKSDIHSNRLIYLLFGYSSGNFNTFFRGRGWQ